jgi:hypothetical protein
MHKYRLALGGALAAFAGIALAAPLAAQAPGEPSAVLDPECDRNCLIGMVRAHMAALSSRDPSGLPVAADLMFTENNVVLPLGSGLWRTITGVDATGLEAADEVTGHAAWFGSVRENGEPAFYAMRLHVTPDGLIDEVETVVHRRGGLPAPFGDWENMEHFPEFNEVLPEEERRPRERLLRIADAYFNTVELNDGQVLAPFSEDCSRLENGISTTAPPPGTPAQGGNGNAAAIAQGCEEQFRLGIYRINKRIRRNLPLVDVERGVVVGSGFFDHANEWDRYTLTDGREMRTALKWPNSITLLEAFRIKDAEIQRIEATFTYVPYFMHNPFYDPPSVAPEFAPDPGECNTACLTRNATALMRGMVDNQWQDLPWAEQVGYAENSVGIRVGEGIWATVKAIDSDPLVVADATTGNAVWIGRIEEHGQPAWAAVTMTADGDEIGAVDALIRRKEYGPPYTDPVSAPDFASLPARRRTDRATMLSGATRFYEAIAAGGGAPDIFSGECRWFVDGSDVANCSSPFGGESLEAIERIRDRRLLAVDEERGLAVFRTFEDFPAATGPEPERGYPRTYQVVELFRFNDGRVEQVHAWRSELPYGMTPH